jgi:hypothetical protein
MESVEPKPHEVLSKPSLTAKGRQMTGISLRRSEGKYPEPDREHLLYHPTCSSRAFRGVIRILSALALPATGYNTRGQSRWTASDWRAGNHYSDQPRQRKPRRLDDVLQRDIRVALKAIPGRGSIHDRQTRLRSRYSAGPESQVSGPRGAWPWLDEGIDCAYTCGSSIGASRTEFAIGCAPQIHPTNADQVPRCASRLNCGSTRSRCSYRKPVRRCQPYRGYAIYSGTIGSPMDRARRCAERRCCELS